jgi:hypothetical protein
MDCVTAGGDAFVAYAGKLRWNGLRLGYTSTLAARGSDPPVSRVSLRQREPRIGASEARWQGLGCAVTWTAVPEAPPIRRRLYVDTGGAIDWDCLMPRARALVELPGGGSLAGWGYVEHLVMTTPPSTVPFQELRWGRFHGEESETVVWIDVRGARPCRFVFRNGREETGAEVHDRSIDFSPEGDSLTLEDGRALRSGRLSSSALSVWPLPWLLPTRILAIDESKRYGPATLARSGRSGERGMALAEIVCWP